MGPPALRLIRKEGVLPIFIALKKPSPWQGLNPQPLGLVISILTTTPPRRLSSLTLISDLSTCVYRAVTLQMILVSR
jgi:hypothetical protein